MNSRSCGAVLLAGLVACSVLLVACAHSPRSDTRPGRERAEVTFHVLGLMKTPSGAT